MKEDVRLLYIKEILDAYNGDEPLHHYLKSVFRTHKQFGSRDRKFYSDTIYKYFRIASSLSSTSIEEKILLGGFLTTRESDTFYLHLSSRILSGKLIEPEWNRTLDEKISFLEEQKLLDPAKKFPFQEL